MKRFTGVTLFLLLWAGFPHTLAQADPSQVVNDLTAVRRDPVTGYQERQALACNGRGGQFWTTCVRGNAGGGFLEVGVVPGMGSALGIFGVSLNLGIRHLMPMYPFLLILAGGWVLLIRKAAVGRAVLGGLLAIQLASVLSAYPDFIAYFNEPARVLNTGSPILVDSNIDWGQDVGRLAEYQHKFESKYDLGTLYFSYFGTASPEAYGLRYQPLAGFGRMRQASPPDWSSMHGTLAISLTNLYGGEGYAGADYRRLLEQQPFARVGTTIYLFRVRPAGDNSAKKN